MLDQSDQNAPITNQIIIVVRGLKRDGLNMVDASVFLSKKFTRYQLHFACKQIRDNAKVDHSFMSYSSMQLGYYIVLQHYITF